MNDAPRISQLRLIYRLSLIRIRREASRYTLGFFWWFADPLINTAILYVIMTKVFATRTENMALFLLTGLLIFRFLQTSITGACTSLQPALRLSQRLYVAKHPFVIRDVISQFFKYAIGSVVLLGRNIYCGQVCPFQYVQRGLNKVSGVNLAVRPGVQRSARMVVGCVVIK